MNGVEKNGVHSPETLVILHWIFGGNTIVRPEKIMTVQPGSTSIENSAVSLEQLSPDARFSVVAGVLPPASLLGGLWQFLLLCQGARVNIRLASPFRPINPSTDLSFGSCCSTHSERKAGTVPSCRILAGPSISGWLDRTHVYGTGYPVAAAPTSKSLSGSGLVGEWR